MPSPTVYLSRPQVLIEGQVNDALSSDAISVLVEETLDGLYRCEARFNNYGIQNNRSDYLYLGGDVLDFGKGFAVKLGPSAQAQQVFKGRISALEGDYPYTGGAQIMVLAEDRLQDLRMTRRTRTFDDMSDEDVIRQIATDHSLTAQLSLSGPTHKVLTQVNQSDLAFIRERARDVNAEVWLDDTTLHVDTRTDRAGSIVTLEYGVNLLSFTVRADLACQVTEVGVTGWDVSAKDGIAEAASENAIGSELNGGKSGSSILQQALIERKERVVHTIPHTNEEARSIAQARYREIARRFVAGAGLADGDARIHVGTTVDLSGLGTPFNGKYYVVRVRHTYDQSRGFRTEFSVERPGLGQAG